MVEISRRRRHEHSPSGTFITLFILPYKRQGKASDVFEKSNRDLCYKDLLYDCSVIVIVYAKGVNREITNKSIVVVCIKL